MGKRIVLMLMLVLSVLLLAGCSCKHMWKDATCTEPKTCSKCGETEGEALGHMLGNWEDGEVDYISAVKQKILCCSVCGEVLESREEELFSLAHDGKFDFNVEEFTQRLENQLSYVSEKLGTISYMTEYAIDSSGNVTCSIFDSTGDKKIADIHFSEGLFSFVYDVEKLKDSKGTFSNCGCTYYTNDVEKVAGIMLGVIMTCEPTMTFERALELAQQLLEEYAVEYSDLAYVFSEDYGKKYYYTFGVSADWEAYR